MSDTVTVTLTTRYSDDTTAVRATRAPSGRLHISHRAKLAAERRLGMISGDYITGLSSAGCSNADGYVVDEFDA